MIFSFAHSQELPDSAASNRIAFLLNKSQAKTITEPEKKEIKNLIYNIQNKGFHLDEIDHNYQGSLVKTNEALKIWVALADTINEANIRKYKGYLLGHLSQFPMAKEEIIHAINLFKIKRFEFGIAVSQFDLSKVYDMEHKLDSSMNYANLALNFWQTKRDTFRIVAINNQVMHLFLEMNKIDAAVTIQKESKELTDKKILHWQLMIDYYFLSSQVYIKQHDEVLSSYYRKLYENKLKELEKDNPPVKSYYDTN